MLHIVQLHHCPNRPRHGLYLLFIQRQVVTGPAQQTQFQSQKVGVWRVNDKIKPVINTETKCVPDIHTPLSGAVLKEYICSIEYYRGHIRRKMFQHLVMYVIRPSGSVMRLKDSIT